jgi:drug/metabolite transporter (DMT)-like permease
LGVLSYQLLFVFGIQRTTAGNASVLLATIPIFVAMYGGIFRRRKLETPVWVGSLLTFGGITLLTLGSGKSLSANLETLPGNLMLLLAAVCWAGYTVGSSDLMKRYSPVKLTALSMLITAPVMDVLSIPELLSTDWSAITLPAWGGLLFSAVFSIAVAYLFWNIAVQRLGDARSSTYSNMTPIVSLVTAWIVLDERLAALQFLGAAIVLAGVWLARFGSRRKPRSLE